MYEGALNFREVAGLPTSDGSRVLRGGLLFRSGTPQLMSSEAARTLIDDTGIGLVIDLRQVREATREGYGALGNLPHRRLSAPFLVESTEQGDSEIPTFDTVDPLVPHYVAYLGGSRESIVSIFRALANADEGPVLIHCTAGKDRTGAALMMLLDAIGIDRAAITEDYVAGRAEIAAVFETLINLPSYGERIAAMPAEARNTDPDTAVRYLIELDRQFGGITAWLANAGFGEDELIALRNKMTVPAE